MTNDNNQQYPSWEHDPEIHGYWVIPGRLLATEYPGAKDEAKALRKLQVLRDAGITSFVDLTEDGERTWDGAPMDPTVIDRMQELRRGSRKADHPVPDTEEQHGVLRRRAQRREA